MAERRPTTVFPETPRDGVWLVALASCFCGLGTATGFLCLQDSFFVVVTGFVGVWSGARKPSISDGQVRKAWMAGGAVATAVLALREALWGPILMMRIPPLAEFAAHAFIALCVVPAVGMVCALRGRRYRAEKNLREIAAMVVFTLGIAAYPFVLISLYQLWS